MVKIKVKCGVGIVYMDANGNPRHALKTPENGPFDCDETQAARLVDMGVAEYVARQVADEDPAPQPDAQQQQEPTTGHLDAEQLEELTVAKLKELAEDMGLDVSGCKKKADYIAAIVAVEVELGPEVDPDADEDPDNDLPDLSAANPE